jgi:hypothetical protein
MGRGLQSLIAHASRPGWCRHGAAKRRHIADGKVGLVISMAMLKVLRCMVWCFCLLGRALEHVETCCVQEIQVECEHISAMATAVLLVGRKLCCAGGWHDRRQAGRGSVAAAGAGRGG